MIDLSTVLTELLFDRDTVIVPGLGMFVRQDDSAKVNVITNRFERPSSIISFDPRQREENDLLAKAIEAHEGCSAEEARQKVSQFVSDCFDTFKQGKTVTMTGLGTLSMDNGETLTFEQEQGANFNGDAFGLGDFTSKPVHDSDTSKDWRAEVIKQNKDKNTPITVDRKAFEYDDEEDYRRRRKKRILYSLLTLLLAIPVVLLLLHFMEIIHLESPFPLRPGGSVVYDYPDIEMGPANPPVAKTVTLDSALAASLVRYDDIPVVAEEPAASDTLVEADAQEVTDTQVVPANEEPKPVKEPESDKTLKYSIIGGCFSMKENADNQVALLHEQGYAEAIVMPRGKQYYVCYARFATLDEAKAELGKIRANSNNKAWILDK